MDSLKTVSANGLEQARECLSLLRYSEGLIRRGIDLARIQLEIKLRKLETRIQAELREIVETETFSVEEVIADINETMKCASSNPPLTSISDTKSKLMEQIQRLAKIRIRFTPNFAIESFLDKSNSMGSLSIVRLRVDDSSPHKEIMDGNTSSSVCSINSESSSVSSVEGERHAPEGEMNAGASVCHSIQTERTGEVNGHNKNTLFKVAVTRVPESGENVSYQSELNANNEGNVASEKSQTEQNQKERTATECVAISREATNLDPSPEVTYDPSPEVTDLDPLSLLRSMKNFENEMKQYPLPREIKTTEALNTYTANDPTLNQIHTMNHSSTLPRSFRTTIVLHGSKTHQKEDYLSKSKGSITAGDVSELQTRGRHKIKSRIPVSRSRSSSPGHSMNTIEKANQNFQNSPNITGRNRHTNKVNLANEMWFGPNINNRGLDSDPRPRSSSVGPSSSTKVITTDSASKHEFMHNQNRYAKPDMAISCHPTKRSNRCSACSNSGSNERSLRNGTYSHAPSLIGNEETSTRKGHHLNGVPAVGRHGNGSGKRTILTLNDKRKRNMSVPGNISDILKEVRQRPNNSDISSNTFSRAGQQHEGTEETLHRSLLKHGSRSCPGFSNGPLHNMDVDLKSKKETYIGTSDKNNHNALSIKQEHMKKHNGHDDDNNDRNANEPISETLIPINYLDRRRRNKTISGDIKSILMEARQKTDCENDFGNYDQCKSNTIDIKIGGGNSTTSGTSKRRRNRTLTGDIADILKEAREQTSSAVENETYRPDTNIVQEETFGKLHSLNIRRNDWESHQSHHIRDVESEHQEQSVNEKETIENDMGETQTRRPFTCRRRLYGIEPVKSQDNIYVPNASADGGTEICPAEVITRDNHNRKLQIPIQNKLRIPSFDEMLYNQNAL